jgi:hypothetical protein
MYNNSKRELPLRGYLFCNSCGGRINGVGQRAEMVQDTFTTIVQKRDEERFRKLANNNFELSCLDRYEENLILGLYKLILEDVLVQMT